MYEITVMVKLLVDDPMYVPAAGITEPTFMRHWTHEIDSGIMDRNIRECEIIYSKTKKIK